MRRKSDRNASKKAKDSPEKKVEKVKRRSTRRKKQSSSSENESADEAPVRAEPVLEAVAEAAAPSLPVTESPEETTDQVWQVKTAEGSGNTGEIKKLKICLTRPPSTPERPDRSPRSKRKHSRATSSSDADGSEEKKKTRQHRGRRNLREPNDSERNHESQSDEPEKEVHEAEKLTSSTASVIKQKQPEVVPDDTPVSTTDEATESASTKTFDVPKDSSEVPKNLKSPVADTTVTSPKVAKVNETVEQGKVEVSNDEPVPAEKPINKTEPEKKQSNKAKDKEITNKESTAKADADESKEQQVSMQECVKATREPSQGKELVTTNENNVVEKDATKDKQRKVSSDSNKDAVTKDTKGKQRKVSSDSNKDAVTKDAEDKQHKVSSDSNKDAVTKDKQRKVSKDSNKDAVTKDTKDKQCKVSSDLNKDEVTKDTEDKQRKVSSDSNKDAVTKDSEDKQHKLGDSNKDTVTKDKQRKVSSDSNKDAVTKDTQDKQRKVSSDLNKDAVTKDTEDKQRKVSCDSNKDAVTIKDKQRKASSDSNKDVEESQSRFKSRELERNESVQSASEVVTANAEVVTTNGDPNPPTPIVINRKRRWGSRISKGTTQKTITISTDVLKEIIPDVKPVEFEEVIKEKKSNHHHKRVESEKIERPVLPKIVIDNTEKIEPNRDWEEKENIKSKEHLPSNRKISIVKDDDIIIRPPSPPRNKQSSVLYITNLVRPFTLPQLKNLLQRTGKIVENGFWIDRIKSKCFVIYENEDQAVETRHALHGVTWPVSNPKALQVDFSTQEAFDKAKSIEENDTKPASNIPGTVEDWIREQDMRREQGELPEKPWERRAAVREWDVGKGELKDEGLRRDERAPPKRRHSAERSPEPARKFKKKEEEAPAKLLDDLFRKTKATPCIYWLPLSAETIAVKEEQRRKHVAEHERRLLELRRTRDRERRH